ncbi:MAG TPA: hypothetical protein VLZ07_01315 [Syntrophales bacterium]|nr:hypothetical protein [Syntrophales bacterium]
MNCQVVPNSVGIATQVVTGTKPFRSAKLYLDIGYPIVFRMFAPGKRKKKYTAERRKSLLNCIGATWEHVSRPYFHSGYFMTPEVRRAEQRIEEMQVKVLDGAASLYDFRHAVRRWEQAVISGWNMRYQAVIDYKGNSTNIN